MNQTPVVSTAQSKLNEAASIEIIDDSDDEGVSSDIDSDFVDVPDPDDVAGASSFYMNQVRSVQMNRPPEVDLTKDFRLSDLTTRKIEVVVKPNDVLDDEDDIFADIFKPSKSDGDSEVTASVQKETKQKPYGAPKPVSTTIQTTKSMKNILKDLDEEMAVATQINLDSILDNGPKDIVSDDSISIIRRARSEIIASNQTEDVVGDDSTAVIMNISSSSILNDATIKPTVELKTNDLTEEIHTIHSDDSESEVTEIKTQPQTTLTPSKSIIVPDEETPPKIVQPFFVKRTPSSKKKLPTNNPNSAQSPSKVAKNLFDTDPVFDEQQAIQMAADLLKETKSKEELETIASQLRTNRTEMELERNKRDRLGGSITERMTQECMELLRLFGIPYIVAPMEAEAQCAFLNQIELTDGTITDDSDIWLFGGKTVYKNFFDQNKHVLEYKVGNIERLFHVDRHKMIQMSILVGSDYTPGKD